MFKTACDLPLSWARWIQSTPTHPTFLQSILRLRSRLCLGLPSGLHPSGFPIKTLYIFLFYAIYATSPPISSILIWSS
jgi:hypothetical protein